MVYTDSLGHPLLQRMATLVEARSAIRMRPWLPLGWRVLLLPRSSVFHIQWIDVIFWRESLRGVLTGIIQLVGIVTFLRMRRVPVVWTVHNSRGKAHRRYRLDTFLRGVLTLLCSRVILLNEAAVEVVAAELPLPLRRRFVRLARILPLPMLLIDHGDPVPRLQARAHLRLHSDRPLVLYLPGANQPDLADELSDPHGRYALLSVRREVGRKGLVEVPAGWQFLGRPTDREIGYLMSACDAVICTDPKALGSMTVNTAVDFRRPVISPWCPAVAELVELGAGSQIVQVGATDEIAVAAKNWHDHPPPSSVFLEFADRHSDENVASAAVDLYVELLSCGARARRGG